MDDGSKQGQGLHLNTYGFDMDSVNRLVHTLEVKFNLKCSIHSHKKGPRIYIRKISMSHLRELVTPHMVPSIMYKLSLST